MQLKHLLTFAGLGLALLQVSCGPKDGADDVNMSNVEWDEGSVLSPNGFLAVKGDVESKNPFTVSFSLKDSKGAIQEDNSRLYVTKNNFPSGKKTLSLNNDMATRVNAGGRACNGTYELVITATSGKANKTQSLKFEVQNGLDPQHCVQQNGQHLQQVSTGAIGNRQGRDRSGFDLVEGHAVDPNSSKRDLQDLTQHGKDIFSKRFGSNTGVQFVENANVNFDTATVENAVAAFATGNKTSETGVLTPGAVLVLWIPRANAHYLIKIKNISDNESLDKRSKNKGLVRFEYRKVTASKNV